MNKNHVSAHIPDWTRERKKFFEWNPGKSLLASHRRYQRYSKAAFIYAKFFKKIVVLQYRFWSIVSGADIPLNCDIGGGLLIPHPNGIVLHSNAKLGCNCLLFQQVTIGDSKGGVPILGGHVDVGAGAKILGPISVGDNAIIGANSVVISTVPSNCVAVGVPARVL